jgi:hypothetical protein
MTPSQQIPLARANVNFNNVDDSITPDRRKRDYLAALCHAMVEPRSQARRGRQRRPRVPDSQRQRAAQA